MRRYKRKKRRRRYNKSYCGNAASSEWFVVCGNKLEEVSDTITYNNVLDTIKA